MYLTSSLRVVNGGKVTRKFISGDGSVYVLVHYGEPGVVAIASEVKVRAGSCEGIEPGSEFSGGEAAVVV